MSSPFVGEIRIFAGNLRPRLGAVHGQLMPISQNTALFPSGPNTGRREKRGFWLMGINCRAQRPAVGAKCLQKMRISPTNGDDMVSPNSGSGRCPEGNDKVDHDQRLDVRVRWLPPLLEMAEGKKLVLGATLLYPLASGSHSSHRPGPGPERPRRLSPGGFVSRHFRHVIIVCVSWPAFARTRPSPTCHGSAPAQVGQAKVVRRRRRRWSQDRKKAPGSG